MHNLYKLKNLMFLNRFNDNCDVDSLFIVNIDFTERQMDLSVEPWMYLVRSVAGSSNGGVGSYLISRLL